MRSTFSIYRLPSGKPVRYTFKRRARDPFFLVVFQDASGKRIERSTKVAGRWLVVQAAESVILAEYDFARPAKEPEPAKPSIRSYSWNEAAEAMTAAMKAKGRSPGTMQQYQIVLGQFRKFCPHSVGPHDVTRDMLLLFRDRLRETGASEQTVEDKRTSMRTVYARWLPTDCLVPARNPFAPLGVRRTSRSSEAVTKADRLGKCSLPGGGRKRYSLRHHGDGPFYYVNFYGPDRKLIERSTQRTTVADAHVRAQQIIKATYGGETWRSLRCGTRVYNEVEGEMTDTLSLAPILAPIVVKTGVKTMFSAKKTAPNNR